MDRFYGTKEAKVRLDVQSGNKTKISYTDPGMIDAPGARGIPFPLTYISGEEELQNQQREIDEIHGILDVLGFTDKTDNPEWYDPTNYDLDNQHTQNVISMVKGGINFNLYQRKTTELLFSTGIEKIPHLLNTLTLGIFKYNKWNVLISELFYAIDIEGTDETYEKEKELASGLHTRLQEEYNYRTKDLPLSTRRDYLDLLRLTSQQSIRFG